MSRLPSSFDDSSDRRLVPIFDRVVQQCHEQPQVPLGALLTTGAVILAGKSLQLGQKKDAQRWFRYRVGFQGFTILALVIGGYIYGSNTTFKEKEELRLSKIEEQKQRDNEWIRKLEQREKMSLWQQQQRQQKSEQEK